MTDANASAPTALDLLSSGAWLGGAALIAPAPAAVPLPVSGSASSPSALAVLASGGFVSGELAIQPPLPPDGGTSSGHDAGTNTVGPAGPVGDKGDQGDPGPEGPQGPAGNAVTHVLTFSNQPVWTVAHGLGRFPSVTCVDTAGDECGGDLTYLDSDTLQIAFSFPVSGTAYLN